MDSFSLYWRYIAISIRAQLAYPATFILKSVGHLLSTGVEFFAIWAMFSRFGTLGGWHLYEVALFYGIVDIGFSIADALGRGFDAFSKLLKKGDFDRMLLRPRSPVLQLLGHELQLMRIGRLSQGIVILVWASSSVEWSAQAMALLPLAIVGTTCLYLGLAVLQATSTFWTIETIEAWNAFTYGGNYAAQYPMSIYRKWFQRFFTIVIPLALTSYYPGRAMLGRDPIDVLHCLAPIAGVAFLWVSLLVFRLGIRHHTSTGS